MSEAEPIGSILPRVMDDIRLRRMKMNIRINNDWKLTTDPANFILEKRKIAQRDTKEYKKGDEVWVKTTFYADLSTALQGLVRHSLLECDAQSLSQLRTCLLAVQEDIQAIKREVEKS